MDINIIESVFNNFAEKKVIIIGDAMVDSYVWGKVERVSPEAPVPVISVIKREYRPGGAANVALNIQALGATPLLFSIIGNDENGRILRSFLTSHSVSDNGIFIDNDRVTTLKSRIFVNNELISRIDDESLNYISREIENAIVSAVLHQIEINQIDLILFVDYDKGVLTPSLFKAVNDLARQKGIPTAVDPKIRNFKDYKNITLFKPNFEEFTNGMNVIIEKDDILTLQEKVLSLNNEMNIQITLVSLSELGVLLVYDSGTFYFQATSDMVADVSGAGDTVFSVAALAFVSGADCELMAKIANFAGGLVCMEKGVTPINKNRLYNELKVLNL